MNKLWIGKGRGRGGGWLVPFLAISYLSLTVITISWNVLTRKLGQTHKGKHTHFHPPIWNQWPMNKQARSRPCTGGTFWHSQMPILTSSAHQSQVLFRFLPFDPRHCRYMRAKTHGKKYDKYLKTVLSVCCLWVTLKLERCSCFLEGVRHNDV